MRCFIVLAFASSLLVAQEADRVKQLERELKQQNRTLRDYGGLIRYGSDNTELAADPDRVIFFGDQITEYWAKFPGKSWLNRGIAGGQRIRC